MSYSTAVKKLEVAGFTREQSFALVDCIYECVGINPPAEQGLLEPELVTPQQAEALMDSIREVKDAGVIDMLSPQTVPQAGPGLPQNQLFGGSGMSLISGIKSVKAIIAWSMLVQIVMGCLAYHFRDYIKTGIDFVIAIGLYFNVLSGGILVLIFSGRRKRGSL